MNPTPKVTFHNKREVWRSVVSLMVGLAIMATTAYAIDEAAPSIRAPLEVLDERSPRETGLYVQIAGNAYNSLSGLELVKLTQFPLTPRLAVDLDLERFWVTGPGTQFVIGTEAGDVAMEPPSVAFFRGTVTGDPDSRVFLSASPSGFNGIIRLGDAEYILSSSGGRAQAADGRVHTIFDRFSVIGVAPPAPFDCQAVLAPGQVEPVATALGGVSAMGASRVALVAIDADWEFRQKFDSVGAATLYALELMAAISTFYEDDMNIKLAVSYLRVWNTSADPFTGTQACCDADSDPPCPPGISQLTEFREYWNSNMDHVLRNMAQLLSGRALGGGCAYVNQMCGGSFAYGVSAGLNGSFPTPLQSLHGGNWDLFVVAHELGHNFRSPHTHCYEPPVDQCWNVQPGCWDGARVCQQGTIMSYCHQCFGGLSNIYLTFGATVSSFILGGLQSCVGVTLNPVYVDASYGGFQQGTLSNPYRFVVRGTWYVAPGGTVSIQAGSYPENLTVAQPMTLTATGGTVTIGQ